MAKSEVNYTECLEETLAALASPGALLVSADRHGKPNVMAIGWGIVGYCWRKKLFMVAVRPSRYTHGLIDAGGEFTVNVLPKGMEDKVNHCGECSGSEHDKFAETGLTPVAGRTVSVPTVGEAIISYECRVVHKNKVIPEALAAEIKTGVYPRADYHTLFFGEILAVLAEAKSPA
jgi:flavin reductase (DIM6/NTAB) family NADH-FMN oxidoreductase RutF